MKIKLGNVAMQIAIGGSDNLRGNIKKKLQAYFTVKDPNTYFAAKNTGRYIPSGRCFITEKGQAASGFLIWLLKWADNEGLDIELIDARTNQPTILPKPERVYQFGQYDLKAKDYEYQADFVDALLDRTTCDGDLHWPRGILDAATNAGKSIVSYAIHKNMLDATTLFLVHSQSIFNQMRRFMEDEMGETVGIIAGKENSTAKFTLAMQKTLGNRATEHRDYLNSVQCVIVDECHKAGAKDYAALLRKIPAYVRVFVSGTSLDTKNKFNTFKLVGLSSTIVKSISKKELMDRGVSEKISVNILHSLPNTTRQRGLLKIPSTTYQDYNQTGIYESQERVQKIIDTIQSKHSDQFILIAFWSIEHGEFMYQKLVETFGASEVTITHGGLSKDVKVNNEAAFKSKQKRIILASTVWKEGINIPHIQVLFYALGGKSDIDISQISGRAERKFDGKGVQLYDFYDDCKHLDTHSRYRIRKYLKEGFALECDYEHNHHYTPIKKEYNG